MNVRVAVRIDHATAARVPAPAAASIDGDAVRVDAPTPLAALAMLDPWLAALGKAGRG